MKSYLRFWLEIVCPLAFVLALALASTSCSSAQSAPAAALPQPCALALATQAGSTKLDQEIAHWQGKSRSAKQAVSNISLEQLGWKYIEKARATYDPGYYKLAEACAACLQAEHPQPLPEALLLRGHALHQMHKFNEAEPVARALVKARGLSFDHGLLGDVLMEQGKLKEAIAAYQEMMNQKPNLQAYSRAAHIRWLTGDLKGAAELATMAARAGSPQDAESTAWAYSRLALYEWQLGHLDKARQAVKIALEMRPDYAPALLVKGRMLLAAEKASEAVTALKQAVAMNSLPDYQWALAEAWRAAGNEVEAAKVEEVLLAKGSQDDPRTLAVYLATRHEQAEKALRLAQAELTTRADVFSYDALAWACLANGKTMEAQTALKQALAAGTDDARLLYHAGVITQAAGNQADARRYFKRAYSSRQMLLPSERDGLLAHVTQ